MWPESQALGTSLPCDFRRYKTVARDTQAAPAQREDEDEDADDFKQFMQSRKRALPHTEETAEDGDDASEDGSGRDTPTNDSQPIDVLAALVPDQSVCTSRHLYADLVEDTVLRGFLPLRPRNKRRFAAVCALNSGSEAIPGSETTSLYLRARRLLQAGLSEADTDHSVSQMTHKFACI